jgi:hypothetical protein
MPVDGRGRQMITFGTESEEDRRYIRYVRIRARANDTPQRIANRLGHPEDGDTIRRLNNLRSRYTKIRKDREIRVPGKARPGGALSVMAADEPPKITAGYAKFSTVDRPHRTGITKFDGYDPIQMDVKVVFEAFTLQDGSGIEEDIEKLERMAGRGRYSGSGSGPPAVIHCSTTRGDELVPLVPITYQRDDFLNPSGPLWRIANIDWDDGALRDYLGNRIRQGATITLQQHVRLSTVTKGGAAARHKRKKKGTQLIGTVHSIPGGKGLPPRKRR